MTNAKKFKNIFGLYATELWAMTEQELLDWLGAEPDPASITSDSISRQAAIDTTWEEPSYTDPLNILTEVRDRIKALPSAQPGQRWIPCSERLPEDDTLMLVNYIDNRPEAMDIWIGWHEMENVWYIDGEAHSKEYGNEVIAWMPLPDPYKGDI